MLINYHRLYYERYNWRASGPIFSNYGLVSIGLAQISQRVDFHAQFRVPRSELVVNVKLRTCVQIAMPARSFIFDSVKLFFVCIPKTSLGPRPAANFCRLSRSTYPAHPLIRNLAIDSNTCHRKIHRKKKVGDTCAYGIRIRHNASKTFESIIIYLFMYHHIIIILLINNRNFKVHYWALLITINIESDVLSVISVHYCILF